MQIHFSDDAFRKDKFKDTGVKSLFIAAVVPKTPENNHNQRQLITALGMEGLEWAVGMYN